MSEHALQGVSAAPGIVAGRAVVLGTFTDDTVIGVERRSSELERARDALSASIAALEDMARRLRETGRDPEAEIIETGVLMAKDPGLVERVESLVMGSGRSAPSAIVAAGEEVASVLASLDDPTLAERAADVRSVARRAAAHASGASVGTGGVLIASDLGPADVADLAAGALGAALAQGGVTAHAAIVARSLGIPMVVGLGSGVFEVKSGELVVLDADRGVLVRSPEASRLVAADADRSRRRDAREDALRAREEPATTTDGHRVTVLVNVATAAEGLEGFRQGGEGIGLLRTELPFLDAPEWPSVQRQVEHLAGIFASLDGKPATVRLFDFGADKTPPFLRGTKQRGIDLLLGAPEVLRAQLGAIVEAGGDADIRVLVPMVVNAEQLRSIRAVVDAVAGDRRRPRLGAMIETPEAALRAPEIAEAADFFSIGTNDLTQLVLGLDRERSRTAPVLDPRVLALIDATVRAAKDAGILVDVCGEAASHPDAMPVLVGLGVDELSVAAARVGEVRQAVRGLDFGDSRRRAAGLLGQA